MNSTTKKIIEVDSAIDGFLSIKLKRSVSDALIDLQEELSSLVRAERKKAKRIQDDIEKLTVEHCAKTENGDPVINSNGEYTGLTSKVYLDSKKALDDEWETLLDTEHELPENLTVIPSDQLPDEFVGLWLKAIRPFLSTAKKDEAHA